MEKVHTDYTSKLREENNGEHSTYHLDVLNRMGTPVFSTTFRLVPGGNLVRVLEEVDGIRFFHGQVPMDRASQFVNSLARRYATAYFLGIVGRL